MQATTELAATYERDGFAFPIRVMPRAEAQAAAQRVIALETQPDGPQRYLRGKSHLAFRFIDELARTPAMLDAVAAVLGPDLLLWGAATFLKEPHADSYVSWHQDLNYWGLDGTDEVTAWLALTTVNEANGCMRFVPGSHLVGNVGHRDTFADGNLLSRGQELELEVDEADAVSICLEPGEISLHHGRLFHASGPNTTDGWRIGIAMRYIQPGMRQVVGHRDFAQLVRGVDRFGHFEAMPRPAADPDPDGMLRYDEVNAATKAYYFKDAANQPA